jgi:hypothetical protein
LECFVSFIHGITIFHSSQSFKKLDVKVIEETVGSLRKRKDLLLELTFVDNKSDDAVSRKHTIVINVEDKHAHGIVDLMEKFNDIEKSAYWTESKIRYSSFEGQQVETVIFLEAPFLAQGERILWRSVIPDKDKRRVIYIRILTNFRIFGYNYNSHMGRARALKDIDDLVVTNVADNKKTNDNQVGIFMDSSRTLDGSKESIAKITTVGDIEFITKEERFISFNNVGNPKKFAQIVEMQREKTVSFESNIRAVKSTKKWKPHSQQDPFHIPSLLGKECCAICYRVLGTFNYKPKKEWHIEGLVYGDCIVNPRRLGVKQINSEEDSVYACDICRKNVFSLEFESENLCFVCFEQKYGKVLLTASRAEYYGGHKVHLAGGTFNEYESGKMYLTEEYLIFMKGNKDPSKRWEIMIPLSSITVEQWNVKGESRRKQITAGGISTGSVAFGGGAIHETGQRHRLLIPYLDENGILHQPVFGISSYGGKHIRKWAETLYGQLVKLKQRSSQSQNIEGMNPMTLLGFLN